MRKFVVLDWNPDRLKERQTRMVVLGWTVVEEPHRSYRWRKYRMVMSPPPFYPEDAPLGSSRGDWGGYG